MALISFAISLFGLLFVLRTTHVFRSRALIAREVVTKTGTACAAALIWSGILSNQAPLAAIFLQLACAAAPLVLSVSLEHLRLRECRARVPLFLDRWILNLRLGHSASAARDAALREESESFRALIEPLFNTRGGHAGQHPILPSAWIKELDQITVSKHETLARLENLRELVRKTSEFRRKSGQAVRQTAVQSFVMLALLLALMLFTVRRYGWTRSADFIVLAALLSVIGVVLMALLTRKWRWKL